MGILTHNVSFLSRQIALLVSLVSLLITYITILPQQTHPHAQVRLRIHTLYHIHSTMKLPTMSATCLAALAAIATTALAAQCSTSGDGRYQVVADGVSDIPAVCGGLWHWLDRFAACEIITRPDCGGSD